MNNFFTKPQNIWYSCQRAIHNKISKNYQSHLANIILHTKLNVIGSVDCLISIGRLAVLLYNKYCWMVEHQPKLLKFACVRSYFLPSGAITLELLIFMYERINIPYFHLTTYSSFTSKEINILFQLNEFI